MALSKYRTFIKRLQSLTMWPCRLFLDIDNVARSGFCYHQFEGDEQDLLRCAFCRCTLANWKRDTDPWQEHATAAPFCIHLMACKGNDYIFRALQKEEVIDGHSAADCFSKLFQTGILKNLYAYGVRKIIDLKQQSDEATEYNPVKTYMTYSGVKFAMPIRIHLTEFTSRRETLNRIPEIYRRSLKLDEMADAGLYFTAPGCLRCYYCDFDFQDWHQHGDPWQLHISQNPDCMHIILIKGDDFVQLKTRQICSEFRKAQHNAGHTWKRKSGPDNEGVELFHFEHMLKSLKLSGPDDAKQKRSLRHRGEKRRQRCACCQQRRREKKLRQESLRMPGSFLQRFISKGNCVGPHTCFKCGSEDSMNSILCVSLCCDIIVCGKCVVNGECPKCNVSNAAVNMQTA
ncbi:baculoviral IAP repeat-containing protein 7-B-like isoform X3 [Mercenaria mercenaria]|uniref:baculoviral IAP repeat-containing protein 7-B-like isoform X3 n=1 Tax=Mercenaria mercenaria TaxID=6596 RepID=UPI00234ECD6C|nr:baculoviral IAP repeat-containing protein 7-B-like isoform X3 [Mercenaria mercenaria]